MKGLYKLLLGLLLVSLLITSCGKKENVGNQSNVSTEVSASSSQAAAKDEPKKVVFLVNGNLGDKGFFDSCASGVNRLGSEYGCEVKIIEMGLDETVYETYLRDVSEQDWDLIITATWSVREVFEEVARDYPENTYLFLDGEVSTPNMAGVTFRSNETGFMAGCLAALKMNENDPRIDPTKKIVGFIGSMDSANINDFLIGYIDGIKYVDDSIKLITSYVGSFQDVATCLEMTTQLYNQGAQIVYGPTSQSMVGSTTASANAGKYIIECDTDVYSEFVATQPELVQYVLSSSLKKLGDAVVVSALGIWDGSIKLGENYSMGLKEGTVGLADNENFRKLVSEESRKRLEEIASKVVSGEIVVSTSYTMESSEIANLRNSMRP